MRNLIHRLLQRLARSGSNNRKGAPELSPEKTNKLLQKMQELMKLQRPFLQPGYSIQSLAVELGVPAYRVSLLINRKMGLNFNDYLNRYRVQYCRELIHQGAAGNLNLKGLATSCGFHNRNTFTNAFKKFIGQTPSNYAKNFRNSQKGNGQYVLFSDGLNNSIDDQLFSN
jgi:AraC-like DNA-binding protein